MAQSPKYLEQGLRKKFQSGQQIVLDKLIWNLEIKNKQTIIRQILLI